MKYLRTALIVLLFPIVCFSCVIVYEVMVFTAAPIVASPPLQSVHSYKDPTHTNNPEITLLAAGEESWIEKKENARSIYSKVVSSIILAHEYCILRRLPPSDHLPHLTGKNTHNSFLVQFVKTSPINKASIENPRDHLESIQEILGMIHRNRIYHLDIGNIKNVLKENNGNLVLIDFGGAIKLPYLVDVSGLGYLLRLIDDMAALKHLVRLAPEELTDEECADFISFRKWFDTLRHKAESRDRYLQKALEARALREQVS